MIGNAVPVNLAKFLALSIKSQIEVAETKLKKMNKTSLKLETVLS